jgi:hypothetical protein
MVHEPSAAARVVATCAAPLNTVTVANGRIVGTDDGGTTQAAVPRNVPPVGAATVSMSALSYVSLERVATTRTLYVPGPTLVGNLKVRVNPFAQSKLVVPMGVMAPVVVGTTETLAGASQPTSYPLAVTLTSPPTPTVEGVNVT